MPKATIYFIILFLITSFEPIRCQLLCKEISRRTTYESGSSILISRHSLRTSNGETIISGKSGLANGFIMRLDSEGNTIWSKELSLINITATFTRVIELDNRDFLLIGSGRDALTGNFSMVLIRLDPDGNLIWSKSIQYARQFSLTDELLVYTVNQTPAGDILIGWKGRHTGTGPDNFAHISVARLTSTGAIVWSQTFESNGDGAWTNISGIFYQNGEVIVSGQAADDYAVISCSGDAIFYAMKLSYTSGYLNNISSYCYREFGNTFFAPEPELFHNATLLSDGNIALTGKFQNFNPAVYHYKVILDNSLELKESKYYSFPQNVGRNKSRIQIMPDGQAQIYALNDLSKQVYWTAISKNNSIDVQRKIPYNLDFNSFDNYASLTQISNKTFALITSYSLNNKALIELNTIDYNMESGECLGTDTSFLTSGEFELKKAGWSWRANYSNLLVGNDQPWQVSAMNIARNIICEIKSSCDVMQVLGPDTVCASQQQVIYKVRRNPECHLKTKWTLDSANLESAQIINDTTISIRFRKENVNLTATFILAKTESCDLVSDTFKINLLPAIRNQTHKSTLCPGSTTRLVAARYFSEYKWQDGSRDSFLIINKPGKYFVDMKNVCDEITTDTFLVSDPAFSIGKDTIVCVGDSVDLIATPGLLEYNWLVSAAYTQISESIINIKPDSSTTVIGFGKDANSCVINDTVNIEVKTPPPIALGKDSSICEGTEVLLNAGTGYVSYIWNTGSISQSVPIKNIGLYIVQAKDLNGCIAKDSIEIFAIYPRPKIMFPENNEVCINQSDTLFAEAGHAKYLWQNGSSEFFLKIRAPDTYRVTVISDYGCTSTDSIIITGLHQPPSNFIFHDTVLCWNGSIDLQPTKYFEEYHWNTGSNTRILKINKDGEYHLAVRDSHGCYGREEIRVKAIECTSYIRFPNAFSPNGDGANETFKAMATGRLLMFDLRIFNRWGQMVFNSKNPGIGWNGIMEGKRQPGGIYVWLCSYKFEGQEPKIEKGVLTKF